MRAIGIASAIGVIVARVREQSYIHVFIPRMYTVMTLRNATAVLLVYLSVHGMSDGIQR